MLPQLKDCCFWCVLFYIFYRALSIQFFIAWPNKACVTNFKISFNFDPWKVNLTVELWFPIEVLLLTFLFFPESYLLTSLAPRGNMYHRQDVAGLTFERCKLSESKAFWIVSSDAHEGSLPLWSIRTEANGQVPPLWVSNRFNQGPILVRLKT